MLETTALGAAYLAGLAVGFLEQLGRDCEDAQAGQVFEPRWIERRAQKQYARSGRMRCGAQSGWNKEHGMNREEMLARSQRTRQPWDMVVIGGGATGAGVAVDAATRGFAVLLLEREDFGKALRAAAPSWCMAACAIWSRAISRW